MKKTILVAATCGILGSATAFGEGDPVRGKELSAQCAACHGPDGNSTSGEWPKLAGQHEGYLVKQLTEFRDGVRVNATMNGMAANLSDQDIQDLAAYFAGQEIVGGEAEADLVEAGEQIYSGGNLASGVPACMACHGPGGAGNPAARFPALAGQHAEYTETQLRAFRSMERSNDAGQMMRNIAQMMTDQEIDAVSSYIQGLQ